MKNLIITMGIMMLMVTGILYDADCMQTVLRQRQLHRVCDEMAAAAAICWEKEQSWDKAEASAAEILQKNIRQTAEWNVEKRGSTIHVKVDLGQTGMRLPFLRGSVKLFCESEYTF